MGGTATTIAIFYGVLLAIGAIAAIAIAASTVGRSRGQTEPHRLAHREKYWLVGVLGALAVLLFSTIFLAPYGESAGADRQVVRVEARQFGWRIVPGTIRTGRPVEFRMTSTDVSHGFGLYDDHDVFLKQVQVMPDREQRLVYTFDKPGTYHVLCMEYCGLDHDKMETTIEVTK